MTLQVAVNETNGRTVIAPKGRLDGLTTDTFVQEGQRALGNAAGHYVLDLSQVPHVSSAGLRGILILAKAVRQANGALTVYLPEDNRMVRDVFRVSGFANVITICATIEEALGPPAG
ncbi:MAG: STAS domain-containing protein [Candidatus Hydrogenedentes bacterium]|nr:STAS domain-containing protein [Candidatus Hydrogenedentota bacterium]